MLVLLLVFAAASSVGATAASEGKCKVASVSGLAEGECRDLATRDECAVSSRGSSAVSSRGSRCRWCHNEVLDDAPEMWRLPGSGDTRRVRGEQPWEQVPVVSQRGARRRNGGVAAAGIWRHAVSAR